MSDIEMEDNSKNDLAYDPDQDAEEKRAIRRHYRDLQKGTEGTNHNDYTADDLANRVRQADSLFRKVKAPQEATLDSHFLVFASNMTAAKSRAMRSGTGAFDIDDFVSKLITVMGGRSGKFNENRVQEKHEDDEDDNDEEEEGEGDVMLDWGKIAMKALSKSRRVPAMDFMLGPLSIEHKKRAQTKRAKLEKNEEEKRNPQELTEEDITRSENETTKNVIAVEKLLTEEPKPINFFRFVINPENFGQSVENLFYLSFLIRDGKCALEMDEEAGEPMIFISDEPSEEDYAEGLKKRQIVMVFDMATWKRAIEVFNITESKIPTRPPAEVRLGDKWYG